MQCDVSSLPLNKSAWKTSDCLVEWKGKKGQQVGAVKVGDGNQFAKRDNKDQYAPFPFHHHLKDGGWGRRFSSQMTLGQGSFSTRIGSLHQPPSLTLFFLTVLELRIQIYGNLQVL